MWEIEILDYLIIYWRRFEMMRSWPIWGRLPAFAFEDLLKIGKKWLEIVRPGNRTWDFPNTSVTRSASCTKSHAVGLYIFFIIPSWVLDVENINVHKIGSENTFKVKNSFQSAVTTAHFNSCTQTHKRFWEIATWRDSLGRFNYPLCVSEFWKGGNQVSFSWN
jgi:hypothetical protein